MPTFASKLAFLLRRKPRPDGKLLSSRDISGAIRQLPGYTRGGSHGAVAKMLRGEDDNPTVSTLTQLAAVLDAPSAFLLPDWDDITALDVLRNNAAARDIARHLHGLPPEELAAVLAFVQERRRQLGLERQVPAEAVSEPEPPPAAPPRRRRTSREAADYAADTLEGF